MDSPTPINPATIIELFDNGLVSSPLTICADLGQSRIPAELADTGEVTLQGQVYPSIDEAMSAIKHDAESTSDAWQFWTWFCEDRQAWTPLEHLRAKLVYIDTHAEMRTSDTHPLRIDAVPYPNSQGRIGLTFCPGKKSEGLYGGTWARDVEKDLAAIEHWGATTLISLMESHEFDILGVPEFADVAQASNLEWLHLPIQDMQTPNAGFEARWNELGPQLHQRLSQGASIVIHCRGGLGRTGLLAARMLNEAGLPAVEAVATVRAARHHSIETYAQEHYVLSQTWKQHTP